MNAAVRSITRMALQKGCTPFAIFEGYQGLVDGGEYIKQLGWEDVQGMLSVGGTSIGTARCMAFRERAGRLTAAFNLVKNGIDALVVIGGDGSLTGADKLRGEWKGLIDELVQTGVMTSLYPWTGRLTTEESAGLRENLTIVGLVGSIDNDMSSTDITIGAVTSLHRICESLDSLTSTALSHQRAFIIEVMGRHCGWLGLMAAISVGADWVFLPERPPPLNSAKYGSDWQTELCDYIGKQRAMGNRKTIIIVCEGAIDNNLAPIRPEDVKTALEKGLSLDSRITTLGHVQRGGTPCAYDRFLATVQGVEAVNAVLRSTPETPSPMIGMNQNKITAGPLLEAVKLTKSVADAIASKDFKKAMDLRDPDFNAAYNAYVESTVHALEPGANLLPEGERLRIGIMHVGAPAGGMNAATRIAARLCLNRGHSCIGIRNGFAGLIRDDIVPLEYRDLHGWQVRGGSELGTSRAHPQPPTDGPKLHVVGDKFVDLGLIAYHLQKHSIDALLIVGGFEAYTSILTMAISRKNYPAFCIPMVHLPATVSNNVPGTDYSVGSDTALNAIVDSCDRLKLSANANKGRVFLVEVQGGNCGYLAVMGGLVAGATNVYIPEEGISLDMLQHDVHHLTNRYTVEKRTKKHKRAEGRLILRAEEASAETYTTEVVSNILRAEGRGLFDSRTAILGHLQQGNVPSPLDRIRATRLAVDCIDWIQKRAAHGRSRDQESSSRSSPLAAFPATYCPDGADACVIGVRGADVVFTPVEELLAETDLKARRGKVAWWMNLKELIRILAKHEYVEHDDLDGSRIDLTKQD
ncbi:phosphofructokinase-domain-containing protein [Polychytrium aggregatum]|uniref:phosphofructokinase-domain-containing protein n=1 Tax=Polychytrium aggregatum TaxID=110093 RepID=UPI0022FE9951|nr:phosphofructokinase-domain-containing protein [Polychytrium aggregatum]KAI9208938.1 phosphofructokinase-domain-containing protein [Polychytrium aggregatum]